MSMRDFNKKRLGLVTVIFGSALIILTATRGVQEDRTFEVIKNLDIFATLYKEVNAYYVDEINPARLMRIGITSMLKSLDPYTTYIPEDDIEDYRTITTGEYGGIGALVDKKNGISTVVLPYKGYPAYRAGLRAGDQIIKINGISLEGKSSDAISQLLKGQSNSDVTLSVRRYGRTDLFDVTLKRERITINNVPYYGMVTQNIGYVKLTDFTTEAGAEVRNAVNELKEDGAVKIILDLRDNPGGLLEEAVNVSNVFIDKGNEVVTTKGKLKNWTKTYKTLNDPTDTMIPLVVLINNSSASASEIVSGVVQDYDRGVLVGQRTFGKGLVQQTRPLAYNSQLKVTTGKYYIPSGRCIQAIDYSSRNPDGSVGKIPDSLKSEFRTQNGRLVYDGGGVKPDIELEPMNYAPITFSLMRDDFIFNYATFYFYERDSVTGPRAFTITDEIYADFSEWLSDKQVEYTTAVEKDIERLIESAKKEQYYEDIQQQIMDLKLETLHNKDQDLLTFRQEISMLLKREIAGRYFYQEGMIESMFDQDPDVLAAVEVLEDEQRYQQLLSSQ